ncbi:SPOR domain-containing protein [Legionella waltersii]|uniref:SPOR domain-containing protein n=1 Tax=Legionella waltersii TaxID=66969 RepID=A0A0W1A1R2_9GAMM|nr:SPOR domain-containing protein [Legionella waltersii]KTD75279.1 hypothetical protein Lwal_3320 [Legionella waltersii]SNV06888.1 Uncharacterized protein conserved in bacteria [Legionella waltersii]
MNACIKVILMGICAIQLSSCVVYEEDYAGGYQLYTYDNSQLYPQDYYTVRSYTYTDQSSQGVVVPDSYHVGEYHSPVSFKDRDKGWVSSQNPQGYTIELADDQKASKVANKLYKAPKNDRMAQVRYQKNGKQYYKGVYGTYNSPEAAQKALEQLPDEVKQGAGVKSWGSVQENLEE